MKNLLVLAFSIFVFNSNCFSQTIIGSYPSLDGGFEGQVTGTIPGATGGVLLLTPSTWSVSTTATITRLVSATGGRSGPKYVSFGANGSGTAKNLFSPQIPGAFAVSTPYQIQFFYKTASSTASLDATKVDMYVNNSISTAAGTVQSSAAGITGPITSWTKVSVSLTTSSTPASATNGVAGLTIDAITSGTFSADIDDYVIYQSASPDNTAPASPGAVSASGIVGGVNVSWGAASGGTDGGGYVAVRYTVSPSSSDDPLQNGVYAIGNTVTGGNTGVVRYIGTSNLFTDNDVSAGTDYYYKVYSVDKAFNYSDEAVSNAVQASVKTFYYKGTGSLASTSSWSITSDLTGAAPADFISDGQVFEIRNTSAVSTDAPWTVAGNSSKIVFGNAVSASLPITLTLTIGNDITTAANAFDISIPSSGNQKIIYQNTTLLSLGNVNDPNLELSFDGVTLNSSTTKSYGGVNVINGANVTFSNTPVIKNLFVDVSSTLIGATASTNFITIPTGGSVIINGTFKTQKVTGFVSSAVGTSGATFGAIQFIGAENLILGPSSTIEYNRVSSSSVQKISARSDYKNLVISGLDNNKSSEGAIGVSGIFSINVSGTSTVSLGADAITNNLTFTSGKIYLGSFNLKTNSISGASSSNYVITDGIGGLTIKDVNSTEILFPIGASAVSYTPIRLANSGISDDFTVNCATAIPCNASSLLSVNKTWSVAESVAGGSAATISFQWNASDANASFNANACGVIRCNGGTINYNGLNGAASGIDPYTRTITNINAFSSFGITSDATVLPITGVELIAKKANQTVELSWETKTETNTSHFIIERSVDGRNFIYNGKIEASGNSSSVKNYFYSDNNPAVGLNYYRLRIIDLDGKYGYSEVVQVSYTNSDNKFTVYPTLANASIEAFFPKASTAATLDILSTNGIKLKTISIVPNNNHSNVDIRSLKQGVYIIVYHLGGHQLVSKFIKQ